MRITQAAQHLGISPRMLRYRESLGLLPAVRTLRGEPPSPPRTASHSAQGSRIGAGGAGPGSAAGGSKSFGAGAAQHRQFGAAELDAVALGIEIERRYDISPAALAFALRVLADPAARAEVAELGRRIGRIRPLPAMAMDFEKERAARFLGRPLADLGGSPTKNRGNPPTT